MTASLGAMTSPLAGRRVLVVDDERAIAAAVVRRLEQDGAVCVAAYSGTEGAERLSGSAFDLVITDIEMPGKSGLDLITDLRALREPPTVIVMAPASDGAAVVEALGRGADGYVLKPFQPEQLSHEVALAAELRTLRATVAAGAAAAGPILTVLGEVVNAYERADPFRAGYSARTGRLAAAFGEALGLDGERLLLAARVHDVGMLAVPQAELHSAVTMDRAAQHLIRVHPTLGARWIERLGADRAVVAAVAAHQERFDGNGYPGGLAGDDIPALARTLGTAAAVAAMCAPRPWRARREPAAVLDELRAGRETQFGAAEADAAVAVLRRSPALLA
ncbi:MAG TPA: response regulator [Gemmatimonadales bacterium]|nr:response regulator [Gemmatimonadales bacterium]